MLKHGGGGAGATHELNSQILCTIKAEITTAASHVTFYLNSASGTQDEVKLLITQILEDTIGSSLGKQSALFFQNLDYSWKLNIEIMVFDELDITHLSPIALSIYLALRDLTLPETEIFS